MNKKIFHPNQGKIRFLFKTSVQGKILKNKKDSLIRHKKVDFLLGLWFKGKV